MRGRSPPIAGPPSLRSFGFSSRAVPPRAIRAMRANALPERRRRVARAARRAVLLEGAVLVPVAVHLGQRPDVDTLTEPGERGIEREQEGVAASLGDVERRDGSAGLDRDHRQRPELSEELRDRARLVPADEGMQDGGALAGLLLEAVRLAEDAEQDARVRSAGRTRCGRCDDQRSDEPEECDESHRTSQSSRCGVDSHSTPSAVTRRSSSSPM